MSERLGILRHLPNFLTSMNILSGCVGIVLAFQGPLHWASWAIFIAAVFDFFDGMSARALRAYSPIGKELDSLADMVSFGVLPSVLVFRLLQAQSGGLGELGSWLAWGAFAVAVFSGIRLAKFNVDTRQSESFIGLPTPANALFFSAFPLMFAYQGQTALSGFLSGFWPIWGLALVFSLLLVSEFPMFSLKFKNLSLKDNALRFGFLATCVVLLLFFKWIGISICILLYLALSALDNWGRAKA